MKTITIYFREVLKRTEYRAYPYKEVQQYSVFYDNKCIENHYENINNPRLRIKFCEILKTRSKKTLEDFVKNLGRKDSEKWLKKEINKILCELRVR